MLYRTFAELEADVLARKLHKRIVLMGSHDSHSLPALIEARKKGLVSCALVGDAAKTAALLREFGEDAGAYEILDAPEEQTCAERSMELIRAGRADCPMKGLMQTSTFFRAIHAEEKRFGGDDGLMSQASVFEYPEKNKLLIVTDCALNIAPGYEEKKKIIQNAAGLAHALGVENPRVAVVSALEVVNPKIPSTVEADALRAANARGEITGCVVGGPFALDNAVSAEAAAHKGVTGPVAGEADILVMPDLCAGNIFHKSLVFFAKMNSAATFLGTKMSIVATSRTETAENKYNAILLALIRA